jgi:response regulator RpfG family c-di-GMP phosphodiesterase
MNNRISAKSKRAAAYCVATAMLESESSQRYIEKEDIEKAVGKKVNIDNVVAAIIKLYGGHTVIECEADEDAVSVTLFTDYMVNDVGEDW